MTLCANLSIVLMNGIGLVSGNLNLIVSGLALVRQTDTDIRWHCRNCEGQGESKVEGLLARETTDFDFVWNLHVVGGMTKGINRSPFQVRLHPDGHFPVRR